MFARRICLCTLRLVYVSLSSFFLSYIQIIIVLLYEYIILRHHLESSTHRDQPLTVGSNAVCGWCMNVPDSLHTSQIKCSIELLVSDYPTMWRFNGAMVRLTSTQWSSSVSSPLLLIHYYHVVSRPSPNTHKQTHHHHQWQCLFFFF